MPIVYDVEQEQRERTYELQRLSMVERERAATRKHNEEVIRLKAELANKSKRSVTRVEALQRVLIAGMKCLTFPFVAGLIWAYIRRNKEVPQYLTDYINL